MRPKLKCPRFLPMRIPSGDGAGRPAPTQVAQVRGYADQKLPKPGDSLDPSNRRISVIVQYIAKGDEAPGSTAGTSSQTKSTTSSAAGH